MLEQLRQIRRERGRARVALLEAANLCFQITLQRCQVNAAGARGNGEIAAAVFQQCQEQVFKVDLVVALRHTQRGGALCSLPAGRVQLGDQGLEWDGHGGRAPKDRKRCR